MRYNYKGYCHIACFGFCGVFERIDKIMSITKRIACTAVAAGCALSLASCGESTSWVVAANGEEIRAGVYLFYQMDGAYSAMNAAGEDQADKKIKDIVIDGVSYDDYAKDYALNATYEFAAINAEFERLGLELTEDDTSYARYYSDYYLSMFGEDYFKELGISGESVYEIMLNNSKSSVLFNEYYKIGGINGTTQEDVDTYFADNYFRFKIIDLALKDAEGNLLLDADKEAVRYDAKELIDRYNNGESFDDLIAEIDGVEDTSSEDTSSDDTADSTDSTDDTSADDSSTEDTSSDDTSADDSSSEDASSDDSSDESVDDESAADEETTDDSATDEDTSSEESDEEEDPYPNELIYNKASTVYSEEFFTTLGEKENGDCFMFEADEVIYVVLKLDISERTDYVEDYTDSLISNMKSEEFETLIDTWVEGTSFEVNDKAVKRYRASKQEYSKEDQ